MGRFTKAIASPRINILLFVIAAALLLVSAVGGTQAALSYYSDTYLARLSVSSIGVTLLENGEPVAWRDYEGNDDWSVPQTEVDHRLLQNMLADGETFQVGRAYPEALSVQNTGGIAQYVRVKLYKYWEQKDEATGEWSKVTTVSPDLIKLDVTEGQGWLIDENDSTTERTVLYFNRALQPQETTPSLSSELSIDPAVVRTVTQETTTENGYTTITTTYDYNGLRFCLEAEVDAVQEHNAQDAVLSTWGKNVTVTDGVLSVC